VDARRPRHHRDVLGTVRAVGTVGEEEAPVPRIQELDGHVDALLGHRDEEEVVAPEDDGVDVGVAGGEPAFEAGGVRQGDGGIVGAGDEEGQQNPHPPTPSPRRRGGAGTIR